MGGSGGVLETLKRGNVPGPDGVLNEMLIYGGSRLVESIASMFKECQVYPKEYKRGFVVLLVKSGDPVLCKKEFVTLTIIVFNRVATVVIWFYVE